MTLDNIYVFAKSIRKNPEQFSEGMEIVYYLDQDNHTLIQRNCFLKLKNDLSKFSPKKTFELQLMDIKFVFKVR